MKKKTHRNRQKKAKEIKIVTDVIRRRKRSKLWGG